MFRRDECADWVIITGAGRTRSTLVEYLLNLHPSCRILHETSFWLHGMNAVRGDVPAVSAAVWEMPEDVAMPAKESQPPLLLWSEPSRVTAALSREEHIALVQHYSQLLRAHWPGRQCFGDKSTDQTVHWHIAQEVLPGCKFILTDRPIDDIIASRGRIFGEAEWLSREDIEAQVAAAHDCYGSVGDRALWVDFSDWDNAPRKALEQVLAHCQLDPAQYPWARAEEQIAHGCLC